MKKKEQKDCNICKDILERQKDPEFVKAVKEFIRITTS